MAKANERRNKQSINEDNIKQYADEMLKLMIDEKLQQEQIKPVIGNDSNPEPEKLTKVETVKIDEPKLQRNEIVKITNGKDTKELKYKKAKPMLETGEWKIT